MVNLNIKRDTALWNLVKGLADGTDPSSAALPFDPQPGPQTLLLETDADEILYGGARGGGKSFGMLLDFAKHAIDWGPSAKGILFRRQFVDLEDIIEESHRIFPAMGAKYSPGKQNWVFKNGAQLRFRYLARESDANKYQGHQYTWMGVEEAGTFASFQTIRKLKATLRSSTGVRVRLHMNANPGGVGHNWLKQRYVTAGEPGVPIVEEEDGRTWSRIYIPARVQDNAILMNADPGYIMRIKDSGPDWLVRAWLDGDWNIVAGGMFDDLFYPSIPESKVIIPKIRIPEHWIIDRSFDWGSSKPFSIGWWVESDGTPVDVAGGDKMVIPRGSKIRIAEWYGCNSDRVEHPNEGIGMVAKEIAAGILNREMEMFGRRASAGVADSAIWISSGTSAQSIASEMASAGVHFRQCVKGPGSRISGWEVMRDRISKAASGSDEPGLYVVETCADWIRTIPSLPRDQRNLDDIDTGSEDHIADETRYYLTSPTYGFKAGTTRDLWRRR